jgi:ribosome-binding protein aMBF1 (putative translation factor)
MAPQASAAIVTQLSARRSGCWHGARVSDHLARVVARAVRVERARAGLSQTALASKLGWSRQVLTAVETGVRRLRADELPEIWDALGVSLRRLLADADRGGLSKLGLWRTATGRRTQAPDRSPSLTDRGATNISLDADTDLAQHWLDNTPHVSG